MITNQKIIMNTFKPFLWSYDLQKINLKKDKNRIITNILNFGSKKATDLLFQVYSTKEIKQTLKNPMPGEWNDKSLNYWSIIFDLEPKKIKNVLRNLR